MPDLQNTTLLKPKVRIKFIDMARSMAILLMLEGHFVDDSLSDLYRDLENPIYYTWFYIRGFTAPVFLTVTGLIFVFLLLKGKQEFYFNNIRVKKGFKRVIELFFWGYLLQYSAFHVLECIATGILSILLIYGLYRIIKFIPLWVYFFFTGFIVFGFYLYLRELPKEYPWPENAGTFIQNAFHGPKHQAIFPIIPNMGFTMFGAMIGTLLHFFHDKIHKWYFPISFFIIGAMLFSFSKELLITLDKFIAYLNINFIYKFSSLDWLYTKLGMVTMILSILMLIDRLLGEKIKDKSLFLMVGQNTLTIFIIHMMLLYGSVIGIGINDYFHKCLGPWEVTIGALLFISYFVILVNFLNPIKAELGFILKPISKFFNHIFLIN